MAQTEIFPCPHCDQLFEADAEQAEVIRCPICHGVILLTDEEALPNGTNIGDFRIIRHIGRSLYGCVYLVKHVSKERMLLMRVLSPEIAADPERLALFTNDTDLASNMKHSNILAPIKSGEVDGIHYQVTRYLKSEIPQTFLEKLHIIPERQALVYAYELADTLQSAFEEDRIIHENVNPGNLLLDGDEDRCLIALDLVLFQGDATQGQERYVQISPYYSSPEQTRNESVTWSTDLYSLGATLYHMIVGLPLYDAPNLKDLGIMHSEAAFPDPDERNPEAKVSEEVQVLLQRMLGKSPVARYLSWQEFMAAVEHFLAPPQGDVAPPPEEPFDMLQTNTNFKIPRPKAPPVKKKQVAFSASSSKVGIKVHGGTRSATGHRSQTKVRALKAKQKQKNPVPIIIAAVVGIVMTILITWLIVHMNKQTKAKKAFEDAQIALNQAKQAKPCNYVAAKESFEEAAHLGKGTKFENQINEQIASINQLIEAQQTSYQVFDKAFADYSALNEKAQASLKESKVDEDKLEASRDLFVELSKQLSAIKTVDDPTRNASIEKAGPQITAAIEDLNKRIVKRDKERAEKARLEEIAKKKKEAEEERLRKEEEARLKKLAEKAEKFKKDIALRRDQNRINFVAYSLKGQFAKVDIMIVKPDEIKGIEDAVTTEVEDYKAWQEKFRTVINRASRCWTTLYDSGDRFMRSKIMIDYNYYEIEKIQNDVITFRKKAVFAEAAKTMKLSDLNTKQLLGLLKKKVKDLGGASTIACFLLSIGEFQYALKYASEEDKAEFSAIVEAYLKARLLKIQKTLRQPSTAEELQKLHEQYGTLTEFNTALEYVNSKSPVKITIPEKE